MIKEIIVVEGRDDVTAVKRALDAELITTGGFGFPKGVMERIKAAQKRRGVIIFPLLYLLILLLQQILLL